MDSSFTEYLDTPDAKIMDARPLLEARRAERLRGGALPVTMFGDIEALPVKTWLVRGLLGKGELSAFYGAPGSGKSVLIGDLAFHVAAGRPWHGRRVTQGPVLYVAAERANLVKRRFAALRIAKGERDLPLALLSASLDLRQRDSRDSIIATAEQLQAATGQPLQLIVIDTVAQVMQGGDENSAVDMGLLLASVGRIQRATGAHVILIHHSPIESPNRMRGHSSLLAACDTTVCVRKVGGHRTADVVKANDGGEDESIAFDLEGVSLGVDADGDQTTAPVVVPVARDSVTERDKTCASRMSRLPPQVEVARRAFLDAVVEHGRAPPSGDDYPSGVRVISLEEWRDHFYRAGITGSDEPEAKRKAFRRATDALKVRVLIGEWEGLLWSAQP